MAKLHPFEALEKDYYMGDEATGGGGRDSEEELSSDDELQRELSKLAGIKKDCVTRRHNEKQNRSQFEMDMECELDQLITDYANEHLSGNVKRSAVSTISCQEYVKLCQEDEMPPLADDNDIVHEEDLKAEDNRKNECRDFETFPPLKQPKLELEPASEKLPTIEEMDTDGGTPSTPISDSFSTSVRSASNEAEKQTKGNENDKKDCSAVPNVKDIEDENPIKRTAKQMMKDVNSEVADFYDPNEDDENEKWMQKQRKKTGLESKTHGKETRPRIDGNSDAVLSCPGCMVLLTRDCQRHEIYSDQYRAMFVENCHVKQESLKIEKTGKEKRRERQRMRKMGVDPNEQPVQAEDIFLPVHCAVCSTNVAVMDHEEVYHFFNVLTGYA